MGLALWPKTEDIAAACVTAVTVPDGLDHDQVRGHVRARAEAALAVLAGS